MSDGATSAELEALLERTRRTLDSMRATRDARVTGIAAEMAAPAGETEPVDVSEMSEFLGLDGGESDDGAGADGLGDVSATPAGTTAPSGETSAPHQVLEAWGEACDGQVRAHVRGDRLTSVTIDPGLRRLELGRLCEHVVTAVNAAWDARDAAIPQTPADLEALVTQLREVQDESLIGMSRFTQAMDVVVDRLRQAGR